MAWDDLHEPKPGGRSSGGPRGPSRGGPQIEIPQIKFPKFKPSSFLGIVILLVLFWLLPSIFYIVDPDEEGVVTRLGKFIRTEQPGLHVKMPSPIEHAETPQVKKVQRAEIGFRVLDPGPPAKIRDVPAESLMLTGDQNIIDIDLVVQYRISDSVAYQFNIRKKQKVVRNVAETVLRELIGKKKIDEALTTGKNEIQVLAKDRIQALLDKYASGYQIVAVQLQDVHPPSQVASAFKDVVSAREDKERMINEAQGYRNAVIPEARGKAARIVREAEAYREQKIKESEGDVQRFLSQYNEYKKAPEITRKRIYLETMEEILPNMQKYIFGAKNTSALPIISLGGNLPKITGGK